MNLEQIMLLRLTLKALRSQTDEQHTLNNLTQIIEVLDRVVNRLVKTSIL